jgi:hypothetical protein
MKTFAIDSSLWELASLSHHYLSSVSTLAKIFQQPMSKPSYILEDFLDHTYTSVSIKTTLITMRLTWATALRGGSGSQSESRTSAGFAPD